MVMLDLSQIPSLSDTLPLHLLLGCMVALSINPFPTETLLIFTPMSHRKIFSIQHFHLSLECFK